MMDGMRGAGIEAELAKKNEELARSNAELQHFVYIASHDLQEPLRMVASYVQLLARRYKGKLDSDADEFIEFALDGALRMQRLINDLLTYSRVNTKGKAAELVDSDKVLDGVLRDLNLAVEEAGATITREPLAPVIADRSQLGQLLQNLISNALKFRGEAAPQVHVRSECDGDSVRFAVRDNGIGIKPDDFPRLFQIFQRLHTAKEYPGTGVGLAVCKRIVERHGGRIWVESEPGNGTTFFFTLPAREE